MNKESANEVLAEVALNYPEEFGEVVSYEVFEDNKCLVQVRLRDMLISPAVLKLEDVINSEVEKHVKERQD